MTTELPPSPRQDDPANPRLDSASAIGSASAQIQARRSDLMQLPGLAAIGLYLLLLSAVIIFGVVAGRRYPLPFLLFAVVFMAASSGLVMLFRWAWALALAAVVMLAGYNIWVFSTQHQGAALIQGLLNLVFFLYLVRPEVREKLR